MPETPGEIDAAIEQVVKTGSDTERLHAAVSVLADSMGYRLIPKQDVPEEQVVHGAHGGHRKGDPITGTWISPCGAENVALHTTAWRDITCVGCLEALT
jgi:hypothetical protein